VSTNRLEAFSDGVMAVAITLLVLDITVPPPDKTHDLGHALSHNWPHYLAYVVSFVTIGIIWINHHAMISRLREADHAIMFLNISLLLSIAVLPFATKLLAEYLRQRHGEGLAAAIYAGLFLLMSVLFSILNRHILLSKHHLLREPMPEQERRRILSRSISGLAPYALATGLAAVSPYVTLIICGAVAVYYSLPIASGSDRPRDRPR
jgi:uncharacterized membrane protein